MSKWEGSGPEGRKPKQVKTLWYLIDDGKKSVSRVHVAPRLEPLNPGVVKYTLG